MSVTKLPADITQADYPFVCSIWNSNGTVTLYYVGDVLPVYPAPAASEVATLTANRVQASNTAFAAKQYAKLSAMSAMSPAQLQTWIAANVTTLAQAQDALLTLAIGQCLLFNKLAAEA